MRTGFLRRAFLWVRTHKLRTVLLIAAIILIAEAASIPWLAVSGLRQSNPAETALMRQRRREAEDRGDPLTIVQRWVPLARLPRHLVNAVVVAEDGTFYTHGGIDWFEVRESFERNIREKRFARGASSITQQLAKNLYLSTSKDPIRKVKELVITFLLENQLDKDRILELYLNEIEWGPGIFGVEAAAGAFFGKSASDLSLEESLRLAAVIPRPLRYRPDENSRYVLYRRGIILERMRARNMVERGPNAKAHLELEGVPIEASEGSHQGVTGDSMDYIDGEENEP